VTVSGRSLTLNAVATQAIKTGTPIKVVRVIDDNMVAVEPQ
jgi:hypothetical protein